MDKSLKIKEHIIVYSIIALLVIIDILSKIFTEGINVELIGSIVSLYSTHNTGAAWSMFSDATIILAIISVLFLIAGVWFNAKTNVTKTKLYYFSFILIFAGAMGNAIDRVFLGYVRDFIRLDFINFPVFNLADSFLVIGVILLAIYIIISETKQKTDKQATKED